MRSIGVPLACLIIAVPIAAHANPALRYVRAEVSSKAQASILPRMPLRSDAYQLRRSSPFIASLAISPNAAVGVGKFSMPPRRRVSLQDQPVSLQAKKVRRAAVGLALRF